MVMSVAVGEGGHYVATRQVDHDGARRCLIKDLTGPADPDYPGFADKDRV
jgi:hypothetical protein